jgi:xanthine dehydrogenase molybdopterin-binding subunit B
VFSPISPGLPNEWPCAVTVTSDEADDHLLAHDMIEVHGGAAVTVVRSNARSAALAGQIDRAKAWIRVLTVIQQQQANRLKGE